jgi:DNA-binding MarR family transcriptional regulator
MNQPPNMPAGNEGCCPQDEEQCDDHRRQSAVLLLTLHRLIVAELGPELASPPYWPMLLELHAHRSDRAPAYQSYFATDEPKANAHRRAARLEKFGAIERHIDINDRRRVLLALTPQAQAKLDHICDRLWQLVNTDTAQCGRGLRDGDRPCH